jgi:glycosyltransferase involved in cell wall biosynthesis
MAARLITCIVPVFNGERYLGEALDSILVQTYRPLDIVVVDDGSTDGTARVVAAYEGQVRSIFQANTGPAAARNRGLTLARGEFIAFLDADDLWHPAKLARQMARFEARPELDVSVTHLRNFWMPELSEEEQRYRDHRIAQAQPAYGCPALLARRALFDAVGAFDTTFLIGEDTEWFARARDRGAMIEVLPDVLVQRRLHQANLTRRRAALSKEAALRLTKTSLDRRRQDSRV